MLKASLFIFLLCCASVWDLAKREIPDAIPVLILLVGLIEFIPTNTIGILCALPLLIPALLKEGSIGGGDVKLMAAAGFCLGLCAGLFSLVAGLFLLLLFHCVQILWFGMRRKKKRKPYSPILPLAPFLSMGCFLSILT